MKKRLLLFSVLGWVSILAFGSASLCAQTDTGSEKELIIEKALDAVKSSEPLLDNKQDTVLPDAPVVEKVKDEVESAVSQIGDKLAPASADDSTVPAVEKSDSVASTPAVTSSDMVKKSWEASGKNDLAKVIELTNECVASFGAQAKEQQSKLKGFPDRGKEKEYQSLNDVATCLFIQAESLMGNGKAQEAKVVFERIMQDYKFAQAWDPSRGAFWSVAEKSKDSIDVLTGARSEAEDVIDPNLIRSVPQLQKKGTEDIVDYRKYGVFHAVGTKDYSYEIKDPKGLAEAVGEGIYPNSSSFVQNSPLYKKAKEEKRLEGSHWDYVHSEDMEAAYFKWVTAPEPPGVKLFYLGTIFEKAKMYTQAIKIYHALIVHFPQSVAWTYWHTPWYPAQAAVAKIKHLLRQHPELNLKYLYGSIKIQNGFDNDVRNDVMLPYPGVIAKRGMMDQWKEKIQIPFFKRLGKVTRSLGQGKVRLVQYENKHWQMLVDNKPYIIKGITYAPTKIGQSPDKGTLTDWMISDVNENGKADGPYDAWVDKNHNNQQDPDEPTVGDFQLMKEMGVNTMRIYHQPFEPNKQLLREMYDKYGIRVILGDFLGKYTFGSGASWYEGTDYENPTHQKNMLETVKKMVLEYKDEPYILFWLLGNENNYGVASNADKKPEAYFKFVNEVAKMIKSVDPNHPVAICNGDTLYLDIFAKNAPDVDLFGANVYRGDYGFGSFWEQVADATGKAGFITEYGAPAYVKYASLTDGEKAQAGYHEGNWNDIKFNSAGYADGVGSAVGGVAFEWLDEWWKNYEPFFHDKKSDAIGPFPGGYYYEEWFGLIAQGKGQHSPFLRQLRIVYDYYKRAWNEKN